MSDLSFDIPEFSEELEEHLEVGGLSKLAHVSSSRDIFTSQVSSETPDDSDVIFLAPQHSSPVPVKSYFLHRMSLDIERRLQMKRYVTGPMTECPEKICDGGVFQRLLEDEARRQETKLRLGFVAQEKEQNEISELLPRKLIDKARSQALFSRLFADAEIRARTIEFDNELSSGEAKKSVLELQEHLERLSTPRVGALERREQVRKELEEEHENQFREIRAQRHPKKALESESFLRITQPKLQHTRTFSSDTSNSRFFSREESLDVSQRLVSGKSYRLGRLEQRFFGQQSPEKNKVEDNNEYRRGKIQLRSAAFTEGRKVLDAQIEQCLSSKAAS